MKFLFLFLPTYQAFTSRKHKSLIIFKISSSKQPNS
nr:MAG TPA: hypothetical protein [Bacteriophage sp.]